MNPISLLYRTCSLVRMARSHGSSAMCCSKCGGYDGKYIDRYIRETIKDIAV